MDISKTEFKRLFSMSLYKNLKIPLGKMTFTKDFVSETRRGDLYPVVCRSEKCEESVLHNRYIVTNGYVERVIGRFFPYATYEISFSSQSGKCGFAFHIDGAKATVLVSGRDVLWECAGKTECVKTDDEADTMIVSCRPGAFDVYFRRCGAPEWVCTFRTEAFLQSHRQSVFENGFAAAAADGCVTVENAECYIDNGISIADIRPVRYENGQVMLENGRLFFTASIRM